MKDKYKYVYIDKDELIISTKSKSIRPAFDTEVNIISINDEEIVGWITEYDYTKFGEKPKFEDVEDEYIEEYKSWFGIGTVKNDSQEVG